MSSFFIVTASNLAASTMIKPIRLKVQQNGLVFQETFGPSVVDNEVVIEVPVTESVATESSSGSSNAEVQMETEDSSQVTPEKAVAEKIHADLTPIDLEKHKKGLAEWRSRLLRKEISITAYTNQVAKYQGNAIICRFCHVSIPAARAPRPTRPSCSRCPQRLIDHARRHLGEYNMTCPMCDYPAVTRAGIIHHLKRKHNMTAGAAKLDERIAELNMEGLAAMIDRCFGYDNAEKPKDKDLTIIEYCDRAIASQIKNGEVQCQLCEKTTHRRRMERHGLTGPIEHAILHLHKMIFSCRLCDYRTYTSVTVKSHLRKVHNKGRNLIQYFDDHTMEHVDEIKAVIDHCYGRPEGLGSPQLTLPPEILEQLQQSKRRIVLDRCRDLIIQFAKSRRLICLLCSKDILAVDEGRKIISRLAIDHACEHVGKPMYKCRSCDKWSSGMQPCIMHVKQKHGGSSSGAYIDMSYKYTNEILRMVNKCFDKYWKDDQEMKRFGLEESDDEDNDSESSNGFEMSNKIGLRFCQFGPCSGNRRSDQAVQKYNLRPRRTRKWKLTRKGIEQTVQSGEINRDIRFKDLKRPFKRCVFTKLKLVRDDGISYGCCRCSLVSKHRALMVRHIRIIHY